ncbi:putative leader peptide [Kribbella deserti]|uniref:Leader peptide n=1 Tax=Kribbella deserti TaxID=1926257 RepID=A0ABV6QGX9_9ACTN
MSSRSVDINPMTAELILVQRRHIDLLRVASQAC